MDPTPRRGASACPFKPAVPVDLQRLKLLLWGPTGTLKTRTALQFPRPVVIDLERGTERYAGEFEFSTLPPATPSDVLQAIRWLRDNRHDFLTLVVDPITIYWAALQRKWSDIFVARLGGRKMHHNEFVEFGPREWSTVKAEFNEMLRTVLQLDMNVVFVAHDKAQYSSGGGDMMTKVGEMPDAEKNLERVFDVIIRCERVTEPAPVGQPPVHKFFANVIKDRTALLPTRFPLEYTTIAQAAGLPALERRARPRTPPSSDQIHEIDELVTQLAISNAQISDRLNAYGVDRFEDLTQVQAQLVLDRLRAAL
jgi:hypothetical protein